MRAWWGLAGVIVALTIGAAPAQAVVFDVTQTHDDGGGGCNANGCTLREAIQDANANNPDQLDEIRFPFPGTPGAVTLDLNSALPAITQRVLIDGSTHANGVILSGRQIGAITHGFAIDSATPVTLRRLTLEELTGTTDPTSAAVRVAGSGATAGHLVDQVVVGPSNHAMNGIAVLGAGGVTVRNSIVSGADVNGVLVANGASDTLVEGATVIDGDGAGVRVAGMTRLPVTRTTVRNSLIHGNTLGGILTLGNEATTVLERNFIFDNTSLGIDHDADGDPAPPDDDPPGATRGQNSPQLVDQAGGVIDGVLVSAPSSTFRIELSFSPDCHPSGFGDGAEPLLETTMTTGPGGSGPFTFTPPPGIVPPEYDVVTATATRTDPAGGGTSEYSNCLTVDPSQFTGSPPPDGGGGGTTSPPPGGGTTPPPAGGGSPFTAPFQQPPPPPLPIRGQQVVGAVTRGVVFVTLPDGTRVQLGPGEAIPFGSEVDTREGRVEITAAGPDGALYRAVFFDGIFRLTQLRTGIVQLKLVERLASCRKTTRARSSQRRRPRKRRLWGDGEGRFRVVGSHSAATVRGTEWLVQDTCKGTLTRVKEGVVDVRDFTRRKTVRVRAPRSYLARPRKR